MPQKSFITLSLIPFILAYTLICVDPPIESEPLISSSSDCYQHDQKQQSDSRNYIVRFYHYRTAEDHWHCLHDHLKFKGWQWIERKNPAARFLTDFGLVAIDVSVNELLLEKFRKLDLVKDVSLDLSYQRIVLEEKSEKIGVFTNGKKRPGKIFTAMSFSEGQNYGVANTSEMKINWNRHLLMQARPLICLYFF